MQTRSSKQKLASPLSNPEKSTKIKKNRSNKPSTSTPIIKPENQTITNSLFSISNINSSASDEEFELFDTKTPNSPKTPKSPKSPKSENMGEPDPFDQPMMQRTRAVPPTPGSAIRAPNLGDSFSVKGHHLKLIQDNQYDGRAKSDPHKHISKFTDLCKMFKYADVSEDNVKLSLFPSSLTGEARAWFEELDENTITTWTQLRDAFVSRFFPPGLARKLLRDIQGFKQEEGEQLVEAWKRLKEMIRKCHGNGLNKGDIVEIFFYGLNKSSQKDLDLAGGGNFLYKSTNDAYKMMEDMVEASLARDGDEKDKKMRRTVANIESSVESEVISELKALSNRFTRLENRFSAMDKELNAIANGCDNCFGPHYTEECDQVEVKEANYITNQYRGGYQRGLFQRNPGNSNFNPRFNANKFPLDRNRESNEQPKSTENKGEPKEDTISKMMSLMENFIDTHEKRHDSLGSYTKLLNEKIGNLNHKLDEATRSQHTTIKDLERKLERMGEPNSNRQTGQLNSNTHANPRTPNQSGATSTAQPNQKYQPPPARNETVNAVFTEGNDSVILINSETNEQMQVEDIKEIGETSKNEKSEADTEQVAPLVVPTSAAGGHCNQVAPLLDNSSAAISNVRYSSHENSSYAQPFAVEVNEEMEIEEKAMSETVPELIQTPPSHHDKGSFTISCTISDVIIVNALLDLGSSVNVMPNQIYENLDVKLIEDNNLIMLLADGTRVKPKGKIYDICLRTENLEVKTDFIVVDLKRENNHSIILGRPFLNMSNAIIDLRNRKVILSKEKKKTCSRTLGPNEEDPIRKISSKPKGKYKFEEFLEVKDLKEKLDDRLRKGREVVQHIEAYLEKAELDQKAVSLESKRLRVIAKKRPISFKNPKGDPSVYHIPCSVNETYVQDTYIDLRATSNILPMSIYMNLLENKNLKVKWEDKEIRLLKGKNVKVKGIVVDLIVRINGLEIPTEFFLAENNKLTKEYTILGQPFLLTTCHTIYEKAKKLVLRVGTNQVLVFKHDIDQNNPLGYECSTRSSIWEVRRRRIESHLDDESDIYIRPTSRDTNPEDNTS